MPFLSSVLKQVHLPIEIMPQVDESFIERHTYPLIISRISKFYLPVYLPTHGLLLYRSLQTTLNFPQNSFGYERAESW
jgi:hypothetical protein